MPAAAPPGQVPFQNGNQNQQGTNVSVLGSFVSLKWD